MTLLCLEELHQWALDGFNPNPLIHSYRVQPLLWCIFGREEIKIIERVDRKQRHKRNDTTVLPWPYEVLKHVLVSSTFLSFFAPRRMNAYQLYSMTPFIWSYETLMKNQLLRASSIRPPTFPSSDVQAGRRIKKQPLHGTPNPVTFIRAVRHPSYPIPPTRTPISRAFVEGRREWAGPFFPRAFFFFFSSSFYCHIFFKKKKTCYFLGARYFKLY